MELKFIKFQIIAQNSVNLKKKIFFFLNFIAITPRSTLTRRGSTC